MSAETEPVEYRYERKYHITELNRSNVEWAVRSSPALFRDIYHRRWINSIYLDSWKLTSYHETQVGVSRNRIKYRIRWYGDVLGQVQSPVLELKIKHGDVGRKEAYPLRPFEVGENLSPEYLHDVFRTADLPPQLLDDLLGMSPVLVNRYSRNYFLSSDSKFRITIDSDMQCWDARDGRRRFGSHWVDPVSIVLELKYATEAAADAQQISQHFPFRMTRNSKYCIGVEALSCHM